jgi:peptidoglycan biosynthesis protein MviN/MurJ (putative lipid II flippase)
VFSAILARDGKQSPRVASRWALLMFALGVFAVIIGWWLAPWVVKLLFERGAFTAHNTQIVTEVFRYGLLQLPFYFGGLVMVSALASQGRYRTIAAIASSNLIVKVAANFIMLPWLGMKAILLATALMYMASMLLCWLAVRRM